MKQLQKGLALLTAVCLAASLAACGSTGTYTETGAASSTASYAADGGWAEQKSAMVDSANSAGASAGNDTSSDSSDVLVENRKIIYTADLSLESTDFENTCQKLQDALNRAGGYIESSSQSGSAENGDRTAQYTFRIPSDHYDAFLSDAQNAGNATQKSENTQDVTGSYLDVEARLKSLETQRDRLTALEEKAESLDDILAIENQLTQVQYQIESYTSQQKAMDDQIDSSTVSVSVEEVGTVTPARTSFAARLAAAFARGWKGFGAGLQDLAVGLAEALPTLVLLAVLAVLAIWGGKKLRARRAPKEDAWARGAKKQAQPPQPPETSEEKK